MKVLGVGIILVITLLSSVSAQTPITHTPAQPCTHYQTTKVSVFAITHLHCRTTCNILRLSLS